tara:strand:- start:304 stop:510 length:207 start_codon:yes stop_codon:yes gene_type:complete
MSQIGKNLVSALKIKYTSEIQCAIATLQVYVNHPVGIGEHPQHIEEMDKLIDTIATNQDKLDTINSLS